MSAAVCAVCIGRILKPHKTGGQFLCRLFASLAPDEHGVHRLSGLEQVELRPPQKGGQNVCGEQSGLLLQLEHLQPVRQTRQNPQNKWGETEHILLKCRNWQAPEPIRPFCNWELWAAAKYASPCREGEFHYCELVGAELYAETGEGRRVVAWVCGLLEGGAQLLLELKVNPRYYLPAAPFYLPFHSSVIGKIEREGHSDLGQPKPLNECRLSMELLELEYFEALQPGGV